MLSGETGRGCCLLRGNPWAAFLGDWEVWRSSDRALERGAHGAKASLPAWAGTARGTAPAGASAGTEGASACARACAPPPGLGSALLRGPCRAASCACLSPLALLAGEATLAGPLRRWPATFWLNKSMSQTNLTSQAPAAAVGRGPSGSIPAPPVLTGPAPASPGAPTRASLRLCASLAPPSHPQLLAFSFPSPPLLCFPVWGCRWQKTPSRSAGSSVLGQLPCQATARLACNLFLPRPSARRPPAPALAPAQPRIAVAC